ncbi:MAG: hypothetical protein ACR5KW_02445 [Wolbachia sp.]
MSKIYYHIFDDKLVVCNYITEEEVKISRDFYYFKVVELNNGNYKLTFYTI